MTSGLIFDIKRFAVHDGPGIRTTLFFKGCPLSCWWCHNPESRSDEPRVSIRHLLLEGRSYEREEITGKRMTIDDLLNAVERDRVFYETSGGGVTLSGGEPLHQPAFCEALLRSLKERHIHVTLDTCGYVSPIVLTRVIPFTDLFLYDIKLMDDQAHRKFTGVSNAIIHDNLRLLVQAGCQVVIRLPLIPDITDTTGNVEGVIALIQGMNLTVHLLPYHNSAKGKYLRFHIEERMKSDPPSDPTRLDMIKRMFERAGIPVTP